MRLSVACLVAVSPSFVFSLLSPSFRSFSFLSFFLLPAFFHLLVFFFFSFFREKGDPPFRLRQGKNEEGKVTFAFLFLFVCSPEEGKESVLLFLSSSRKGERECVLSFCFMIKEKEKRTFSVLFSSSASDKKHSFRSFFFFLKKESVLSPASVRRWEGRFIAAFFFFSFFLLSERKRKMISACVCWRSLLFSFRLQEKKRRYNASANGERKNIHAFQKERSGKG